MENNYTKIMTDKSVKELMKVIELKAEYQPEAVIAAEIELKKRKEQFESGNIPEDAVDNYEFDFIKTVRKASNEELINWYKTDFKNYSKVEIEYLTEELNKRKIEPKVWYYTKGNQKNGPFTGTELKLLVEKNEVDYYDYIWREGIRDWVQANNIDGLFDGKPTSPPIGNQKPNWLNQEKRKEKSAGVIIAAIVLFLTVPIWIIIALTQAGISLISSNVEMIFLSIWNIFFAIASIAMGVGVLQLKKWGYRWGLNTAIVNVIWFGFNYSNSYFFIFLLLIEALIAILLYSNRKTFKVKTKTIETIYI